ncbi:MAG TPA: serine/threonine-protein kinase, partial [Isosphaeraceae bacterium]|nr:serine/threonine-protein kinase [Isosphaeraceae bacterium]
TILQVVEKALGRTFALKVVKRQSVDDDIYIAQALHELEVAQQLDHRTLLKIYDGQTKRKWLRTTGVELLMEFVDGRTLDDLQSRDVGQLVLVFSQVASGLNHMHRRGVYHGDLKPANIMLSRAGAVKIIDFGTAWIRGQPKDRVQGTPQYMAPEQASDKVVDDRTDLYNFGATMYRLLTGEYANLGGLLPSANGALGARSKVRPPIGYNPNIPGTLNETVMACLDPDPDRRPAGAFEVKHQLKAVAKYLGLEKDDLRGSEEGD